LPTRWQFLLITCTNNVVSLPHKAVFLPDKQQLTKIPHTIPKTRAYRRDIGCANYHQIIFISLF
jgi:hypothetical protein